MAQTRLAREEFVDAEAVRLTAAREPYIDALLAIAHGRRILDLAPAPLFLRRRHLTHRMHLLLKEVSVSKLRLLWSYGSMTAIVAFAGWFALASFPLAARPQPKPVPASLAMAPAPVAVAPATPTAPESPAAPEAEEPAADAAPALVPCEPQAYVPNMLPLFQTQPALPEAAYSLFGDEGAFVADVTALVTVGPEGSVTGEEVLTGMEILRQPAIDAIRHFKYRPVIRHGQPVCAHTTAMVTFETPGRPLAPHNLEDQIAAMKRMHALEIKWPRSPEEVLADMQQDSGIPGGIRRRLALPKLAKAALDAGALDQAVAYAQEALSSGPGGDAIFNCNMVLGLVALRNGNVGEAKQYLVASGKTSGSPALDSFGPNMSLAKELLDSGERDAVLEFFSLCRTFWANQKLLDSWSETVRNGRIPDFGANLRY